MVREGPALFRIGTHLLYGLWLELGTSRMAARPWLRIGLETMRDDISRIITSKMKGYP